ncbi:MAG: hypothetical protein ABH848_02465 [Candidatus Omnitrophota bacterium]
MKNKFLAFFVIIFLGIFVHVSTALAIKLVQIDQAKIRLSILPGKSQAGMIRVSNASSEPKQVKTYLEDWVYNEAGDGSKDFTSAGTTKLSGTDWITFSPADFTVPPNWHQDINYRVSVPKDAEGGHYAVLFFENLLEELSGDEKGVAVPVAVRMGTLFYIEAKNTINKKAEVNNFDLKIDPQENLFTISADFLNTGNVDIESKASFYIIDDEGIVHGRGEFKKVYTFPNDIVRLAATTNTKDEISEGVYDLIITFEIGKGVTLIKEIEVKIGARDDIIDFRVKD